MLRRLGLLALAALALVAPGCGGGDEGEGEPTEPAAQEEPIKVGLVTDIGGLNDRSFNSLAYEGLKRAQEELGVRGRPLESKSDSDYIPHLESLAQEDYDLVIGVGFVITAAPGRVAKA